MSILKKDLLFKMIKESKIKSFTILGIPTNDLVENFFNRRDLTKFLDSKNIKCNIIDKFDGTDIGIYFPSHSLKQYTDICSINVSRLVEEEEFINILNLFSEVLAYYQTNIPPRMINQILGLYKNEPITFSDMLYLISDNQSEIARKINRSKQVIADIKHGRSSLTIDNLSLLMKEYPLLPWEEYIEGISTKHNE